MIPRLYLIETRFYSKEYIRSSGIDAFLGNTLGETIEKYKLVFYGMVVQDEATGELQLIGPDEKIVLVKAYEEYCHWHDGPLGERDDPLQRTYCLSPAATELGYCGRHKTSIRAIYSKCFSSAGLESLRSCWMLDEKLGESIEYAVYLLAYGHNRYKVGSTRKWRIHDRVAEQPHVAATILYESRSAVKTRDVEIRAGRLSGLSERPRRRLVDVISSPLAQAVVGLAKTVEKTRRALGITGEYEAHIFRVEPANGYESLIRVKEAGFHELIGRPLIIRDYYAGFLILEEPSSSTRYALKGTQLLHINCLRTVR